MSDDDTLRMPQPPTPPPRLVERVPEAQRVERWLIIAMGVAYLMAGAILSFALFELASVADQINTTPFCRRI